MSAGKNKLVRNKEVVVKMKEIVEMIWTIFADAKKILGKSELWYNSKLTDLVLFAEKTNGASRSKNDFSKQVFKFYFSLFSIIL